MKTRSAAKKEQISIKPEPPEMSIAPAEQNATAETVTAVLESDEKRFENTKKGEKVAGPMLCDNCLKDGSKERIMELESQLAEFKEKFEIFEYLHDELEEFLSYYKDKLGLISKAKEVAPFME